MNCLKLFFFASLVSLFSVILPAGETATKTFIAWSYSTKGALKKMGTFVNVPFRDFDKYETVLGELSKVIDGKLNLPKEDNQEWFVSDVLDINFHSFKGRPRELSRWLSSYPSLRCVVDLKEIVVPVPWGQAAWNSFSRSFWATGSYISSLWAKKKK